jgi:hypothetical protein
MAEEEEELRLAAVWKTIRGTLKTELLAGNIPAEPREMKPKEVYQKFVDQNIIDYTDKKVKEKFGRMLRLLRSKHKNGDLDNEDKPTKPIEWAKSAAKHVLRHWFRDGTISSSFENEEIEQIWKDHCKDNAAFKRMKYDEAFVRRIKSVRDDHQKKVKRCEDDLKAYTAAKLNHPTPLFDHRGKPQWNGSEAQRQLKELIAEGLPDGKEPRELWLANQEFQKYELRCFRDHIYQEKRLQKFNRYVENLRKEKIEKLQY